MLSRLRFRNKLMMFPALASLAFLSIMVAAPLFSQRNEESIARIQTGHVPAFQASQRLQMLLDRIQRMFQDAAAAENDAGLAQADELRDAALEEIAALRASGVRDPADLRRLEAQVRTYYDLARRTTQRLIRGDMSEESVAQLREMSDQYNQLRRTLDAGMEADQHGIDSAFASAVAANRTSLYTYLSIVVIALILMVVLATWMTSITMKQLNAVSSGFGRMAGGDFSTPVEVVLSDELGDLGTQLNVVRGFVHELAQKMKATSAAINSAAAQLSASARVHQQGASEQSSAVSEIRRTMESTLQSADDVTASAEVALRNAEDTQEKNVVIAGAIQALSAHTDRIGEILENIKDIANKSELLALNAALEGTKAGEAGRGFSLVATQMQRLAENVIGAVRDIKRLTIDIQSATSTSVDATTQGTSLAKATTESARQIRMVMQQHRSSTELASHAMDDIVDVAHQAAAHSQQVMSASKDLAAMSEQLVDVVARLNLEQGQGAEA